MIYNMISIYKRLLTGLTELKKKIIKDLLFINISKTFWKCYIFSQK